MIHLIVFILFSLGFYLILKLKKQLELIRSLFNPKRKKQYLIARPSCFIKNVCLILGIEFSQSEILSNENYRKIKIDSLLKLLTTLPLKKIYFKISTTHRNHDTIKLYVIATKNIQNIEKQQEDISKDLKIRTYIKYHI